MIISSPYHIKIQTMPMVEVIYGVENPTEQTMPYSLHMLYLYVLNDGPFLFISVFLRKLYIHLSLKSIKSRIMMKCQFHKYST